MGTSDIIEGLILASAVGAGLVAGIFFTFSNFVMRALGRLPDAQGIAAMQSVNVAVLNPWFFAVFFGTGLGAAVLVAAGLLGWGAPGAGFLMAGGLFYLAGAILVTGTVNVPLNNALARLDPDAADAADVWHRYRARWTAWNHLRTATSLAAALCLVGARM